jgi:hypothetical protein
MKRTRISKPTVDVSRLGDLSPAQARQALMRLLFDLLDRPDMRPSSAEVLFVKLLLGTMAGADWDLAVAFSGPLNAHGVAKPPRPSSQQLPL